MPALIRSVTESKPKTNKITKFQLNSHEKPCLFDEVEKAEINDDPFVELE